MTFEQPARKKGRHPSGLPFTGRVLLYSGLYSFGSSPRVQVRLKLSLLYSGLYSFSCTASAQALPKPYTP